MQDQTNQARPLAELSNPQARESSLPVVSMGFGSLQSFELMQRAAKMLAYSTLVPAAYRVHKELKEYGKVVGYEENPAALPNCVVALNMAQRMGADPLMVMQNLYIVEGRPSWSSQFIIAAINSCGRYSPLRFEMSVLGEPRDVEYTATEWVKVQGQKDQRREVQKKIRITPRTCVAWAVELATGDRLESPVVSMDMAVAEGWIQKNGSKWQTMPEVMLRYRSAAFFGKLYAPELLMGLQTAEEAQDIIDVTPQADGKHAAVHLGELRDTGAPEAHGQAAAPEEEAGDQVQAQQAPEAGQPAAVDTQASTDQQQPASEAAAPAAAEATTKPAALTPEMSKAYEGIAVQLNKAGNLDQLAEAADLINTINQPELRHALTGIYRQRMAEFSGGQQDQAAKEPAPAAPAKRTRGAKTTGTAPE